MKINKIMSVVAILVLCIIFQVIAFVIPSDFSPAFWISYAFSIIAFIVMILFATSLNKLKALNKGIFPYILIYCTGVYAVIELILFLLSKFIDNFPTWLSVVLNVLVLGVYGLIFICIYSIRNHSNKLTSNVDEKVYYIKDLQVTIEMLVEQEQNNEIKGKLLQLLDKIKYSDPMSSEKLQSLELEITNKVNEFKNSNDKLKTIEELQLLIDERSKRVKILKETS